MRSSAGATAAEAHAQLSRGLSVNVRLGEVETLEHMQDRGVSVTVLIGRRKGQASSADLRPETIAACVDRALDIARYTEEDPCNGLADPGRLAVGAPDLDLWHPSPVDAEVVASEDRLVASLRPSAALPPSALCTLTVVIKEEDDGVIQDTVLLQAIDDGAPRVCPRFPAQRR